MNSAHPVKHPEPPQFSVMHLSEQQVAAAACFVEAVRCCLAFHQATDGAFYFLFQVVKGQNGAS